MESLRLMSGLRPLQSPHPGSLDIAGRSCEELEPLRQAESSLVLLFGIHLAGTISRRSPERWSQFPSGTQPCGQSCLCFPCMNDPAKAETTLSPAPGSPEYSPQAGPGPYKGT